MGQLPQIEYGTPVESVPNAGAPGLALRQLGNVIEEGLTAYAKEQIKTEQIQAEATTQKALNDATLEIQARTTIPAAELRDILGENIPGHIAPALKVQKMDPSTGQMTEVDNDQVPMYLAAGAIYDKRAKDAITAGMSQVTLSGWKAEFQDKAQQHVESRRMVLAQIQLRAMHEWQVAQQKDGWARLRNTASTPQDFANLNASVRSSDILEGKEKVHELAKNLETEQLQPVLRAEASNDPKVLELEARRLRDPKAPDLDAVDPKVREAYAERMDRQRAAIAHQAEVAEEKRKHLVTSNAYNQLAQVEIAARSSGVVPPADLVFGIVRRYAKPGMIDGEQLKALTSYAESISKGTEIKTDLDLYQQLEIAAAEDPEAFKADKITLVDRTTGQVFQNVGLLQMRSRLSDSDFKKFAGIQGSLSKEGRESSMYQDFLGVTGYMKSKLEADYGFDVQKPSDDQRKQMATVSIMVNTELSTAARLKGSKLNTVERDKVIDQTLARAIKVEKGWFSQSTALKTANVDPDLAVAFSSLSNRRMKEEDIIKTAKDFAYYSPSIESAWQELSPRVPLTTERAVQVYSLLASRWRDIDAELVKAGQLDAEVVQYGIGKENWKPKAALDAKRSAMAVKWYLRGVR